MNEEAVVVEETPIPAQDVQTGAPVESTESAPVESGDTPATEPEKTGVQKRIDKLTFEKHEAERQAEYWRQQNQAKPEPTEQPTPTGAPTLDQFDDYEGFVKALAGYEAKQQFATLKEQQSESIRQAEQAIRSQNFQQKAETFAADHPDFQQVVFDNRYLPITDGMKEVIEASDKGPNLAYHLGQNPQEAARIAQMPPMRAAVEMGKLEATMSIPKAPKTTGAPPPITPLGGGDASVKDPSKMTTKEFIAWRRSNL